MREIRLEIGHAGFEKFAHNFDRQLNLIVPDREYRDSLIENMQINRGDRE